MSYIVDDNWIAATSTYNYMMKDPLIDWLKLYHGSHNKVGNNNFTSYIMEQGKIFEREVIKLLTKKFGTERVITIASNFEGKEVAKTQETLQAMKKGIPFIHSGVIHNTSNKTFGLPDLLVRSDWLKHLVSNNYLDEKESKRSAPKLGKNNWHYRVVDIKFTSLLLRADGIHLLNSGSFSAYKSQLLIYNWGLGRLQGYTPDQSYILGRRWKYTSKGETHTGDSCFDRLGVIDYRKEDRFCIKETRNAIKWLREVRSKKAAKWNITKYPLHRWELYPNMCNYHDNQWRSVKDTISKQNKELTSLWMVGPKNRNHALDCGIYQWNDEDCNAATLSVNGEKVSNILNNIIEINNSENIIAPDYIINNIGRWKYKPKVEFFVDFETCNGAVFDIKGLPKADTTNVIFMIGVGYIHPRMGKWIYKNFIARKLSDTCEEIICREFKEYIREVSARYNISQPRCIHWSHAEEVMWNSTNVDNNWEWLDLLKVFKEEPIVINGCLNFGLKDVARTMYNHGLIQTSWSSNCGDGLSVMMAAKKAYETEGNDIMDDIAKYNEVDVKVLEEIITYLRTHHTKRKFVSVDGPRKKSKVE